MLARCTGCNHQIFFEARRGAKLKEQRCACGSRYEPMYSVRVDDNPGRGWSVYRNYNGTEYNFDAKNATFVLITPTATP